MATRQIQSLAKGLQILDMLVEKGDAHSVSQIAAIMGVDKSSVSRLLRTMEHYGFVQREKNGRRYNVGKRLHTISRQLANPYSLRQTARAYLDRLAYDTSECAHIGVYADGQVMVTDDVQPETSLLRVVGNAGRLIGLHNTAVGKALIAFGDYPLPEHLPLFTPRTIVDLDLLREHLVTIRREGYAFDDEENEPGVRCIACPVFDELGITVATIGISGPTVRITYENLPSFVRIIKQSACDLSHELGFNGEYPA
jgi:DNA-binding IclR family transcriptional regulator